VSQYVLRKPRWPVLIVPGEFGHMPFGAPAGLCRCGAKGCWNTTVDGRAAARLLRQRVPADDVSYFRHVLASARAWQPGALSAIRTVGSSIGRGVAGLVNGLDPQLLVVAGLGPDLLHIAAGEVTAAYRDGLMTFRPTPPPPARLGTDGPLLGAADEAFAHLRTDQGLHAWVS
jgi:predicted NBD/HSP70 family sugar kinase